jgi:hypothetical protein
MTARMAGRELRLVLELPLVLELARLAQESVSAVVSVSASEPNQQTAEGSL